MSLIKNVVFTFFPPHSPRGAWLKSKAVKLGLAKPYLHSNEYAHWIDHVEPYTFVDVVTSDGDTKLPIMSIVIPTYNTKQKYLDALIYSIVNQSYKHWRLVLADASTKPSFSKKIKEAALTDSRIKYVRLKKNDGISNNTNAGIEHVKSEYVVFMDHDDTLSPHALNEIAAAIIDNKNPDILYSDEDKLTDDGITRHTPHFKPDWSPHQYLTCNWTSHLSVVKTELVKKIHGLDKEMDGSQDYDLILRILALPGKRSIVHVPKILYHWRVADGSTAGNFDEKSYALVAGCKSLQRFMDTRGFNADVTSIKNRPGFYDVVITPAKKRKALVIVNSAQNERQNETFMQRIIRSSSSTIDATFVTAKQYDKNKISILSELSDDDVIVSVNGYYETLETKWLDRLTGVLEMDDVRAVAPIILTTYGSIKDAGIIVDSNGKESGLFSMIHKHSGTMLGHAEWIRDVARLSGRFYATKKSTFIKNNLSEVTVPSKDGKYDVVWSNVKMKIITETIKKNSFFNENLSVNNAHRGEPNVWEK